MPGLVPGIHVFVAAEGKAWMAGTSPAMTEIGGFPSPGNRCPGLQKLEV